MMKLLILVVAALAQVNGQWGFLNRVVDNVPMMPERFKGMIKGATNQADTMINRIPVVSTLASSVKKMEEEALAQLNLDALMQEMKQMQTELANMQAAALGGAGGLSLGSLTQQMNGAMNGAGGAQGNLESLFEKLSPKAVEALIQEQASKLNLNQNQDFSNMVNEIMSQDKFQDLLSNNAIQGDQLQKIKEKMNELDLEGKFNEALQKGVSKEELEAKIKEMQGNLNMDAIKKQAEDAKEKLAEKLNSQQWEDSVKELTGKGFDQEEIEKLLAELKQ